MWYGSFNSEFGLLWLYVLGYATFVALMANLLSLALAGRVDSGLHALLGLITRWRLRWVWVLLLVGLAGLPPVFLFGPKLGLLLSLYGAGFYAFATGLGLSVFAGWVVYFQLGRFLTGSATFVTAPSRLSRLRTPFAVGAIVTACVLLGGGALLDDLFLFVTWLLCA